MYCVWFAEVVLDKLRADWFVEADDVSAAPPLTNNDDDDDFADDIALDVIHAFVGTTNPRRVDVADVVTATFDKIEIDRINMIIVIAVNLIIIVDAC